MSRKEREGDGTIQKATVFSVKYSDQFMELARE